MCGTVPRYQNVPSALRVVYCCHPVIPAPVYYPNSFLEVQIPAVGMRCIPCAAPDVRHPTYALYTCRTMRTASRSLGHVVYIEIVSSLSPSRPVHPRAKASSLGHRAHVTALSTCARTTTCICWNRTLRISPSTCRPLVSAPELHLDGQPSEPELFGRHTYGAACAPSAKRTMRCGLCCPSIRYTCE
ncbi:hypothetical protein EXIGLDRAFT_472966 [Exidia glandulosa HHB12029]|uniref:Uncharacterized protein n=1 Tax=Exidia glandulosa HHB12029 TaxID=1314781 RepID=A0A166AVB6_EXIGL|nr:hypothetical protein EXIGLDRAFT_472966 [Exidia glandulosa HHB12029]